MPRSVEDPLTTTAVNIEGTLNVLLAARDEGVRRIVNASSSSSTGTRGAPARRDAGAGPDLAVRGREARRRALLHELQPRLRDGDRVAPLLQRLRATPGPESQYAAVVPRFIRAITDGDAVTVYGDGEQSRDFTFVDNVVAALAETLPRINALKNVLVMIANGVAGIVFVIISEVDW